MKSTPSEQSANIVTAISAVAMRDMKLRPGDYRVLAVSSMEQIIGTALSTVVGIVIPLIQLMGTSHLSSLMQGVIGAAGLLGIALGSAVIGKLIDRQGYLLWFRLCPAVIMAGAMLPFVIATPGCLVAGMFVAGIGVGGGYTLDSAYISEIMPDRWKQFMVGIAKATCAIGSALAAGIGWWVIKAAERPQVWPVMMLIIAVMGLITLLLRLQWRESPVWLAGHGRMAEAQKAAEFFLGKGVKVLPPAEKVASTATWGEMFRGRNLIKVAYSGLTWACEGLGVYGFGVFLPVLVMALGIESDAARGTDKVINSVEMTFWINMFIIPGFIIGLLVMRRMNNAMLMGWGFIGSAAGLLLLWLAYAMHWPVWCSVIGFLIFEIALNGGPHLITFIIPSVIYPVSQRGVGDGIAAMLGKVGAVLGVFFMPMLLESGGMTLVLWVSIAVMALGALLTFIPAKMLGQFDVKPQKS